MEETSDYLTRGDHPKLTALKSHLDVEFSSYKYTIYRCASKVAVIQKVLFVSKIPYTLVMNVLDRHRLSGADKSLPVHPEQLTSVIHDLFFACDKMGYFSESTAFDLETATAVLANFFWNIFDPHRKSPITQLDVKGTFFLLCSHNSSDQIAHEFFQLGMDHNRCISRFRFEAILKVLAKVYCYVGEGNSYGPHVIPLMLEHCFQQCPGMNGINEYQFNCLWHSQDNSFSIYTNLLDLIYRIKETESIVHNVPCSSCSTDKIIGIRFKCEICKKLSLCMKCFSIGFHGMKHDPSHRMYEVYFKDVPSLKRWAYFFSNLCNIFCKTNERQRTSESTIYDGSQHNELDVNTAVTNLSCKSTSKEADTTRNSIRTSFTSSFKFENKVLSDKLSKIIEILKNEDQKITAKEKSIRSLKPENLLSEFLIERSQNINNIIDELNGLIQDTNNVYPVASTPNWIKKSSMEHPSHLSRSVYGAEINKSYLEENKSDYSLSEISTWFSKKKTPTNSKEENPETLSVIFETMGAETEMQCFRDVISRVKEILDDSYSDNTELAEATNRLETVLNSIIVEEEQRRRMKYV